MPQKALWPHPSHASRDQVGSLDFCPAHAVMRCPNCTTMVLSKKAKQGTETFTPGRRIQPHTPVGSVETMWTDWTSIFTQHLLPPSPVVVSEKAKLKIRTFTATQQ